MKKFYVIGNPIDHSLSPKLHNFWFKKNKIDAIYEKKLMNEEEIPKLIESIRKTEINGANVTVPFKNSVIPFLDNLSSEAKKTKMENITVEGADLAKEIGQKVNEDFDEKKLPLMLAMINAITKDKKLELNWDLFR